MTRAKLNYLLKNAILIIYVKLVKMINIARTLHVHSLADLFMSNFKPDAKQMTEDHSTYNKNL